LTLAAFIVPAWPDAGQRMLALYPFALAAKIAIGRLGPGLQENLSKAAGPFLCEVITDPLLAPDATSCGIAKALAARESIRWRETDDCVEATRTM
jgi:hypothetical protein